MTICIDVDVDVDINSVKLVYRVVTTTSVS